MAFSASTDSSQHLCEICPDQGKAQMRCLDCDLKMCMRCMTCHMKTPMSKDHKFAGCNFSISLPTEIRSTVDEKELTELLASKISNLENDQDEFSDGEKGYSRIIGRSSIKKVLGAMQISNQLSSYRLVKGSFCDIMGMIQLVKTKKLQGTPYRLAMCHGNIWVTGSDSILSYNENLDKVNELHTSKDLVGIKSVQQFGASNMMMACENGLSVCTSEGEFLYKVLDGNFSDLSINGDKLVGIDYKQNKIVFVAERNNKWELEDQYTIKHKEKSFIKTIHCLNNSVFVCFVAEDEILSHKDEDGTLLKKIGSRGSLLGQFNTPFVVGSDDADNLIVCDSWNHRFQVVDPQGEFRELKVPGVEYPGDVLITKNNVYILHGPNTNRQLSKYSKNQYANLLHSV